MKSFLTIAAITALGVAFLSTFGLRSLDQPSNLTPLSFSSPGQLSVASLKGIASSTHEIEDECATGGYQCGAGDNAVCCQDDDVCCESSDAQSYCKAPGTDC